MTDKTGSEALVREMRDLLEEFPQKAAAEALAVRFRDQHNLLPTASAAELDENSVDAEDEDAAD